MEKVGAVRLDREQKKLLEYLESWKTKIERKTGESNGDSGGSASASSGGPAAPTGEVPRSKVGVPIQGDTTTDATKRKSGDSEPGESEDPKDNKIETGNEEERGTQRSIEDLGEHAKRRKIAADA